MHSATRRTSRRRRALVASVAAAALVGGAAGYVATSATASGLPTMYTDHAYPAALAAPSSDKQQSKLWRGGGAWWGVLVSAAKGVPTIHELRTNHTWRDTGTVVDTRADSTADVWFAGTSLHVVSRTTTGSVLYSRFTYNATTRSFTKATGFPKTLVTGGVESASLARDSLGFVWATWTKNARVYLARTTSATLDTTWSAPTLVPAPDNTVSTDDISAIVAFNKQIGIMWSDQQSDAVRFAIHADGAALGTWKVETPLSGADIADDHISLKAVGGDARVFAAVKTSYDAAGATDTSAIINVLRRNADGTWVKAKGASVGDKATRPQLALDRENQRVYLFTTGPATGGTIYYKSSPFVGLKFARGRGAPLMAKTGATLNDVSTLKGSVSAATGTLTAIASDTTGKRYHHAELPLSPAGDTQPPIASTTINAVLAAPAVTLTWPLATDDRGIVAYDVFRNNVKIHTITITTGTGGNEDQRSWSHTDPNPGSGTWTYAIQARDAAGNTSDKETARAVTIP